MSDRNKKYDMRPVRVHSARNESNADESTPTLFCIKNAVFGALFALLAAAVLLLIGSAVAYSMSDPNAAATPIAIAITYIAFFAGGFITSKLNKDNLIVCSVLNWAVLSAIMLLFSLFFGSGIRYGYSLPLTLGLHALSFPADLAGAALGLKQRTAPRHPAKRRR